MPIALAQRSLLRPEVERLPSAEIATTPIEGDYAKKKQISANNGEEYAHNNTYNRKEFLQVSFHMTVSVRPSLHVNDFTDEEYFNSWYSPDEMADMKADIAPTLRMVKNGMNQLPPHMTLRGLEFRSRTGAMKRRTNKTSAMMAVLNEQELQLSQGYWDPEQIRKQYLSTSQACQKEAYARGLDDALEVMPLTAVPLPPGATAAAKAGSKRRLLRITRRKSKR
mmetsp:Transcript_36516/g.51618  ORF Transcript_36516/g.51618 Transcript_36516/m.51618 type:complete len:223 (+) Transcript_36516:87-755(+)